MIFRSFANAAPSGPPKVTLALGEVTHRARKVTLSLPQGYTFTAQGDSSYRQGDTFGVQGYTIGPEAGTFPSGPC